MAARAMIYFQKGLAPKDAQHAWKLKALAYQAVQSLNLEAKEILIRSIDIHNTTTISGRRGIDPKGYHTTFSLRTATDIANETFVSVHAYTKGKDDFNLVEATRADPIPITAKNQGKKLIWPQNLAEEAVVYVDPPEEPESSATGSGSNEADPKQSK